MQEEAVEAENLKLVETRLEGMLRLYGWNHELSLRAAEELIHLLTLMEQPPRGRVMDIAGRFMAGTLAVYREHSLDDFFAKITFTDALRAVGEYDLAISELLTLVRSQERFEDWDETFTAVACDSLVSVELEAERFVDLIAHAEWAFAELGTDPDDREHVDEHVQSIMAAYACALLRTGREEEALDWATVWLDRVEEEQPPLMVLGGLRLMEHIDEALDDGIAPEWLDDVMPRLEVITGVDFE